MTQLVYGGYEHATNSVSVAGWNRQTVLGGTGWPERLRYDVSFRCKIVGSSMANVMAQVATMQLAYSVGGQSLAFYDSFGNQTVWSLNSGTAIGGVIVTNPVSYGEVKGAEGTLYLYATVGLSAEYLVATGQYMEFKETVGYTDNQGLPLTVERLPINAPPIIQATTAGSFFYATQSGELWSSSPNPQPMAPLAPSLFRGQPGSHKVTQMSPKTIRGVPYRWGVSWSYDYVDKNPIYILPNVF